VSVPTEQRPSGAISGVAVGWTAVAALAVAWVWYDRDLEKHSGSWALMTVAAVAVSVGLAAVAAVGARRDAGSGTAPAATVLAVVLWGMGVLWYLALGWMGFGNACGGTGGACSWECLNQASGSWQTLSVLPLAAATVAPPILLAVSRRFRSRAAGRTAPALVIALVIAAVLFVSPHGSDSQCFASALTCPTRGATVFGAVH
jgi:hypothetical protein